MVIFSTLVFYFEEYGGATDIGGGVSGMKQGALPGNLAVSRDD